MDNHLKAYDVLELKAKLIDRITEPAWIEYMDNFLRDISRKNGGDYSRVSLQDSNTGEILEVSNGGAWCLGELSTLMQSDSYLIGAQMNPLIRQAAADIPEDLLFEEHIVPSKYGFLVFEEPWATIDVHGKRLLTRAITWQPMSDQNGALGVQVAEYTALSDNDDISQQLRADPRAKESFMTLLGDLQVQHIMPIQCNVQVFKGVDPAWSDLKKNAATGPVKAMVALWMLMQQRVTETVVPSMTIRSTRRWERKKVKPAINVVNLRSRRIVSQSPVEHALSGHREWAGRWMVKGHWRNQPFGPGRQERHWVYVHPFLKGPDNLPFIERPKVYKLSR